MGRKKLDKSRSEKLSFRTYPEIALAVDLVCMSEGMSPSELLHDIVSDAIVPLKEKARKSRKKAASAA